LLWLSRSLWELVMRLLSPCAVTPRSVALRPDDRDLQTLLVRVSAEFQEMPGLILTLAQAARLFSLDAARCRHVLGTLVDRGILSNDGQVFRRADAGLRVA
jgi:hypothetical protein